MSELKEALKSWRRYLHMHPETAFEELKTSEFLAERLEEMGLEVHRGIGGTGIVADLKVGDGTGIIGLRADMDAIHLEEQNELDYKSIYQGKMHACGHDGHMATLLGAAKILSECRNFKGTVRFLFQPAEELGKGAYAMIRDGLLEKYPMDEIYGFHNAPAYPEGRFLTRAGHICSSEDNFEIIIRGRGGHASTPHLVIDPLVPAAEIFLALQTIVSRNVLPNDFAVISCTELHTDGAHNTIPGTVSILGDTRSYSPEVQKLIEERMKRICESTCQMNGARCEFKYTHEFAPTINWAEQAATAVNAAIRVVGEENVEENCLPFRGSEDFGVFLEKIPGCFVYLGAGKEGEKPGSLHSAHFDYNDDILETGAKYFAELVKCRLGCK